MRGIPVRYYGIGNALTVIKGKSKKRKDCEKGVCYFGRGMLYFFGKTLKDNGVELEMNGNTADLHRMPPEGGGGTVCPDSICTLRNAQHSTAQITQSSLQFARRTVAAEKRHLQSGAPPVIRQIRPIRPIRPMMGQHPHRPMLAFASFSLSGRYGRLIRPIRPISPLREAFSCPERGVSYPRKFQ